MTTTTPPDARNALAEIVAGLDGAHPIDRASIDWENPSDPAVKLFVGFDVEGYVKEYELCLDDGDYSPNDWERTILIDAIYSVVSTLHEQLRKIIPSSQDARIAALEAQVEGMRVVGSGTAEEWEQKWIEQQAFNDSLIAKNNRLENERVRLWNKNRDLSASLDVEKAVTDSMRTERDAMRTALKSIAADRDCGCKPSCQCNGPESLEIELDALRDIARAALQSSETTGEK